jgi:hypothetical protein
MTGQEGEGALKEETAEGNILAGTGESGACIRRSVANAKKNARFRSGQAVIDRFFVMIVLRARAVQAHKSTAAEAGTIDSIFLINKCSKQRA